MTLLISLLHTRTHCAHLLLREQVLFGFLIRELLIVLNHSADQLRGEGENQSVQYFFIAAD